MALSRDQSYLLAKYLLMTFTVLTLIATFVGYGVVLKEIDYYDNRYGGDRWHRWRTFAICYLVFEDIVAIVGLWGAHKEHYRLVLSYGIAMSILWFFNFFNIAIARSNVFNYLVTLGVIATAFYFARRIRIKEIYPQIESPAVYNSRPPAVIQVQPTYIPSPAYPTVYTVHTEPQATPPPPYTVESQPRLEFKQ